MRPYVQTYSVIVGTTQCNAHCPFCISKITPKCGMDTNEKNLNVRNLIKGGKLAKEHGATTALITGKGEPTLYMDQLKLATHHLAYDCGFNIIELQTNGINFNSFSRSQLENLYFDGLTTIIISCVHYDQNFNKKIYSKYYPDLRNIADTLHDVGFSIRLSCMLLDGYIDTPEKAVNMTDFCKKNGIEQLTMRALNKPNNTNNAQTKWIEEHNIKEKNYIAICDHVHKFGHKIGSLVHGAEIFDYRNQNVCLANCLTLKPETDEIRQLIYFPDGHIRYDWCYEGAILL